GVDPLVHEVLDRRDLPLDAALRALPHGGDAVVGSRLLARVAHADEERRGQVDRGHPDDRDPRRPTFVGRGANRTDGRGHRAGRRRDPQGQQQGDQRMPARSCSSTSTTHDAPPGWVPHGKDGRIWKVVPNARQKWKTQSILGPRRSLAWDHRCWSWPRSWWRSTRRTWASARRASPRPDRKSTRLNSS